ncbi:TonB-dependent receptor plug domain-containing protein [Massilia sp. WG5]|uniref:TonB-dependent receptor plug domain-containing protein n=1 Tax=Massilia sp. WG5 TaxID=1707785 RepID=UPI0035A73374
MAYKPSGVNVNEVSGSSFQSAVTYRGFRASPVLGSSQGISVYLDGVRVNGPFGDLANWDMVPEAAIGELLLVPGANPLYGMNTLGRALAFRTKSGSRIPAATPNSPRATKAGAMPISATAGRAQAAGTASSAPPCSTTAAGAHIPPGALGLSCSRSAAARRPATGASRCSVAAAACSATASCPTGCTGTTAASSIPARIPLATACCRARSTSRSASAATAI